MRADRVRLGIDFGTSSTVAVVGQPDGQVRPLLFGETPILPSAVCMDWRAPEVAFLVGRDAIHAGRAHPDAFEPNPKLRVDDGSVLLGSAELPVTALIGAVLRRVGAEAERVAGAPADAVTLTYPASWGPRRRAVLQEAAAVAGLPEPAMVAEPVAAAAYFVETLGHAVPVGQCVVVYDLGAGTFDASVVGRTDDGFTVLAEEGLRDAGGLDIDNAIVAYFGATYGVSNGELWRRLTHPETPADRRTSRHFWDDVRTGKEMLSRSSSTSIFLPLVESDALLGREQLEHLARPLLDRSVTATAAAIRAAQVDASRIAGLFLVGGSSRIPLAATLLHRVLGIAPTIIEQPELVVAGGSLIASATAANTAPTYPAVATATVPVAAAAMPAAPVSPSVPAAAAPTAPAAPAVSASATATVPVAAAAMPAAPVSPSVPAAAAPTAPAAPAVSASATVPVYTMPSAELPSTFEQPVPPGEQTPVVPFAAGPVSAAPVSAAPMSAAPVSPGVGATPVSPPAGHFAAAPVSAAPVSPPAGTAPFSPPAGTALFLPPVSAAPVSPVVGQFPTPPVSGAPTSGAPTTPDAAWPPTAPLFAAPPAAPAVAPAAPPAAPAGLPAVPGSAAAVRGLGIGVVATALLRFALMFQDNGASVLVLHAGFEPVFDYLALAVLVALGGWLIARPGSARPALAVIAGFTPWALLPIVGDIGLIVRYQDWTDDYPLMTPMLVLQVLALLAVVGLVYQAALQARTARGLVPLGLAAVAFWTSLAAMLWLTSGYIQVVAAAQMSRIGLALGVGTVVVYAAAGSRAWAGWTVGAWLGGAVLWMAVASTGDRAEGMQVLPAVLMVLLLAAAAALLTVLLRTDRGAAWPHAGLAKGPAVAALGAAGIAVAGLGLILYVQLEQWSYVVNTYYVAGMFASFAGLAVLLGGLVLLAARRSAGAAAYCVGAAAGPVSLLASPDRVDAMRWPLISGLVLFGVAALILVAVLVRSAPTRLSWPRVAVAMGCLLLVAWSSTAEPYIRLDSVDRWLLLALFAAIPAAVLWKGGLVTAGALFGVAAGSAGAQFVTVYDRIDDGPGVLLGVAVLATFVTGLVLARSTPEPEPTVAG